MKFKISLRENNRIQDNRVIKNSFLVSGILPYKWCSSVRRLRSNRIKILSSQKSKLMIQKFNLRQLKRNQKSLKILILIKEIRFGICLVCLVANLNKTFKFPRKRWNFKNTFLDVLYGETIKLVNHLWSINLIKKNLKMKAKACLLLKLFNG